MKNYRLFYLSLLLAVDMILGAAVHAQANWTPRNNGLTSLFIVGITIQPDNPSLIYARTRFNGTYKSIDAGASWTKLTGGLPDYGPPYGHLVNDGIVIDNQDPNILYAVSTSGLDNYGRIYKSTNGGANWSLASTGASIGGLYGITGLIQDYMDPNHLYAGTIVTGFSGGIFESTNRAGSWTNIAGTVITTDGDLGNDCWPIRMAPNNSLNLYCGSPHDSLLYSRDGGYTWTESNPAGNSADKSTYMVALNPQNASEVWIDHPDGSYKSIDGALSWINVSSLFDNLRLKDMAFAPSNSSIVYALAGSRLYKSLNNGSTWAVAASETWFARCVEVDPSDPNIVYMGTWGRGVLKSTNGGVDWTPSNNGMPATATIDIDYTAAHPTISGRAFCHLKGNGIYRTDDFGANWTFLHPLFDYHLDGLSISPANPNLMFASWYSLYRSKDGGQTWDTPLPVSADKRYRGVHYDPNGTRIWVLNSCYDTNGSQILYSDNSGDNWTPLPAPGNPPYDQYNDIAVDPYDPNILLLACSPKYSVFMQDGWLYRSTNRGQNWTEIRTGLELRDWSITAGQWGVKNDVLVQSAINECNMCIVERPALLHDGTYTVRTRITQTKNNATNFWSGMSVCLPSLTSNWNAGVLAGMRANGEVFLWSSSITRVSVPGAVANTATFQTLGIRVFGNTYTLMLNGADLGTWTDPSSAWGTGYMGLANCSAKAEFDDVSITAPPNFTDNFNIGNWGNGNSITQVVFSPNEPGVAYLNAGLGIFRSGDHGLTWSRITASADENVYCYDINMSRFRSNNLYFSKGSFYPPSFSVFVFPNGRSPYVSIGTASNYYYRTALAEDAKSENVLYASQFGPGFEVYQGPVPGATVVQPSFWLSYDAGRYDR